MTKDKSNSRLDDIMQWVGINEEELRARSLFRQAEARRRYLDKRFSNDEEYLNLVGMRRRFNSMLFGHHRKGRENAPTRNTSTCWKMCGCSITELRAALQAKFYDDDRGQQMTWKNHGRRTDQWVIDHIKPICLFDWWTHEGRQEAFHHSNTQPLWYWDHKAKCVEDRALARLRKQNDPAYAGRVKQWGTLPDVLPTYEPELSDEEILSRLERQIA